MCSLNLAKLVKYIEEYDFNDFFSYYDADDFIDYLYYASSEFYNQNWSCKYGSTKLVIIMNDEDYVIKIPFHGEDKYEYYEGAPCTVDFWDYCQAEEERYENAPVVIKSRLAKTQLIYETKNGIRLYSQPKCSIARNAHCATKSKKTAKFFYDWWGRDSLLPITHVNWLNTYIDCYGLDSLKAFFKAIIQEDWNDDLRDVNIGFLNGRPVLVDYSSFCEQCLDEIDLTS